MINSKYFRVPKKKEPLQENEVHVTSRQEPINFLRYAIFLFEKRNLPYIKFKASGSAIASLVNIAEILKKTIPGIHQVNKIYTLNYEQDYEPKEKGLNHVTIVRNVPILEVSFYKVLLSEDVVNEYGYQAAISQEVFERVQINISNLIRKKTNMNGDRNGNYRDNRSQYSGYGHSNFSGAQRGRGGGYKFGFRGGRGGGRGTFTPGFRGRGGYTPGFRGRGQFAPGFRGRGNFSGSNTRGGFNANVQEGQSEIGSDYSRGRGRGRGFGAYRSKFDNVEPRNDITNTNLNTNTNN